jgi:hypothetical protein
LDQIKSDHLKSDHVNEDHLKQHHLKSITCNHHPRPIPWVRSS